MENTKNISGLHVDVSERNLLRLLRIASNQSELSAEITPTIPNDVFRIVDSDWQTYESLRTAISLGVKKIAILGGGGEISAAVAMARLIAKADVEVSTYGRHIASAGQYFWYNPGINWVDPVALVLSHAVENGREIDGPFTTRNASLLEMDRREDESYTVYLSARPVDSPNLESYAHILLLAKASRHWAGCLSAVEALHECDSESDAVLLPRGKILDIVRTRYYEAKCAQDAEVRRTICLQIFSDVVFGTALDRLEASEEIEQYMSEVLHYLPNNYTDLACLISRWIIKKYERKELTAPSLLFHALCNQKGLNDEAK